MCFAASHIEFRNRIRLSPLIGYGLAGRIWNRIIQILLDFCMVCLRSPLLFVCKSCPPSRILYRPPYIYWAWLLSAAGTTHNCTVLFTFAFITHISCYVSRISLSSIHGCQMQRQQQQQQPRLISNDCIISVVGRWRSLIILLCSIAADIQKRQSLAHLCRIRTGFYACRVRLGQSEIRHNCCSPELRNTLLSCYSAQFAVLTGQ